MHREVTSAAARLDQFLSRNGVASDERVTVISDDAGEFGKTVEGSQLARGWILDWFHIAMRFKAAERSVFGSKMIDSMERESVETEITHAKWLLSHGKASKGLERIKAMDSRLLVRGRIRIQYVMVESKQCLQLPEEERVHFGQLRRPASQGPADQQQHRRVCGEPGCQLPNGQATPDAVGGRRSALHGTGQGCGVERGILPPSHLGAQDCRLALRRMRAGSVGRRGPANGQNRRCNHAISYGNLTKATSPTLPRSLSILDRWTGK